MLNDIHMITWSMAVSSRALSSVSACSFVLPNLHFFMDNSIANLSISWSLSSPHYQLFVPSMEPFHPNAPLMFCYHSGCFTQHLKMLFHLGILLLPPSHKLLNISEPLNTSCLPYCKFSALVYLAYKKCSVVFAFGINNINISTQICFISFPTSLPVSSVVLTQDPSILFISFTSNLNTVARQTRSTPSVIWRQTLETGRHQIIMRNIMSVQKVRETKRNVSPRKWRLNWNPSSANNRLNEAWREDTPGSWRNIYRARWPGSSGPSLACLSLWNLPRSKSGIPFWKWSLYSLFSVAHNMLYFPAFFPF